MKKIIILFSVLFIALSINAQDSTLVTDSNVEKLVDKYSGKVEAVIVSLAESLQQPAEHIYKVLVKQQVVKAIIGVSCYGLTIFFILISFWILRYTHWGIDEKRHLLSYYSTEWEDKGGPQAYAEYEKEILTYNENDTLNMAAFTFIGTGVLSIILLIVSLFSTNRIITGFVNPEYQALQDIFELVSKF